MVSFLFVTGSRMDIHYMTFI